MTPHQHAWIEVTDLCSPIRRFKCIGATTEDDRPCGAVLEEPWPDLEEET